MICVGGPYHGKDIASKANVLLLDGRSGRYCKWRELDEVERYYLWQEPGEFHDPPQVRMIKEAMLEAIAERRLHKP